MLKTLKNDIPASIVVFFVALPLCLGIALASGAPLFSGLISGIVGGIIVGFLSGSKIGVSGPAAGLAAIVLTAIGTLGSYENFLVAVVLGGCIQLLLGFLKAGIIGYFFPSSVIKGMLTGIGIIIILKQIPHFLGYNADPIGDEAFLQADSENSFSELSNAVKNSIPGSFIIGTIGLCIILFWDKVLEKKAKFFTIVQGPFVAVVLGIVFLDLLKGIALGLSVGIVIILIKSYQNSHFLHKETAIDDKNHLKMTLAEEVTFFNKGAILNELDKIPHHSYLEIDVRKTQYLDYDIIEILEDFLIKAKERHIEISIKSHKKTTNNPESFVKFFDEIDLKI